MHAKRQSLNSILLKAVILLMVVAYALCAGVQILSQFLLHPSLSAALIVLVVVFVCLCFRTASARIVALIIVFCLLPALATEFVQAVGWARIAASLVVISFVSYVLLRRRFPPVHAVPRIQGAERTPVVPPAEPNQ